MSDPGNYGRQEWQEIDFDNRLWEVPKERMKMRRPHCVPLPEQAIKILEQLKNMTGQYQFIFPGRIHHSKPMSEMAMNVLIRRIGYAGRVTGQWIPAHHEHHFAMSRAITPRG